MFHGFICFSPSNKPLPWATYDRLHFQMRKTEAQESFPRPGAKKVVELKFKPS